MVAQVTLTLRSPYVLGHQIELAANQPVDQNTEAFDARN